MRFEVVTEDGTTYSVERERDIGGGIGLCIHEIQTTGKVLAIPKALMVEGRMRKVTSLFLIGCFFPDVEVLILPKTLQFFHMRNCSLPHLKELQVAKDSDFFWTDGKMLFRKSWESWSLVNSFVAGNQDKEPVVIPNNVTEIEMTAFKDTICTEIIFPEKVYIRPGAFKDSEYAKLHPVHWKGLQWVGPFQGPGHLGSS